MSREIKFEYGFDSVNRIVKKIYHLHDIPNIRQKCDVWDILPFKYVRQFTGLLDKNKVEIFEGDIIKWGHLKNSKEYSHRYAVVEINPDIQFKIIFYIDSKTGEKKPTDNYIFHWGRFAYSGKELEIIGNVFQNPELLETVQK